MDFLDTYGIKVQREREREKHLKRYSVKQNWRGVIKFHKSNDKSSNLAFSSPINAFYFGNNYWKESIITYAEMVHPDSWNRIMIQQE